MWLTLVWSSHQTRSYHIGTYAYEKSEFHFNQSGMNYWIDYVWHVIIFQIEYGTLFGVKFETDLYRGFHVNEHDWLGNGCP